MPKSACVFFALVICGLAGPVLAAVPSGVPASQPASRPDFENVTALLHGIPKECWAAGLSPEERQKRLSAALVGKAVLVRADKCTGVSGGPIPMAKFVVDAPSSPVPGKRLRCQFDIALDPADAAYVAAVQKTRTFTGPCRIDRVLWTEWPREAQLALHVTDSRRGPAPAPGP